MIDKNDMMQDQTTLDQEVSLEEMEDKAIADVEKIQDEVNHLKEQLLRSLADLENLKKRSQRELQDVAKYAVSEFARDLLAVSDNLRRALECATETSPESFQQVLEGVSMTEKELLKVFEKNGIQKISPVGEKFDHNLHQAIFESEEGEDGLVTHVMQPGYKIHDRLLRPAMVGVGKGPSVV